MRKQSMSLTRGVMTRLPPAIGAREIWLGIIFIVVAWAIFLGLKPTQIYYALEEFRFFRHASFYEIFTVMDFGSFQRFSPLGVGLIGYLDANVLVPLLGMGNRPVEALVVASRLAWLHPVFLLLELVVVYLITWRLFRDYRLVALAIALVGLSDTNAFQMRFVSTLVCYLLQISTLLAIYFFVRLADKPRGGTVVALVGCVFFALCLWEQGINLAIAMLAALMIALLIKRSNKETIKSSYEYVAFFSIAVMLGAYLILRMKSGAAEALSPNSEASYFLTYRKIAPMVDDVILNSSALSLQAFRQFLPIPPLSFSVMRGVDMNVLNPYNLKYAQFPNMSYRMMALWYSGAAFVLSLGLVCFGVWQAVRVVGRERYLFVGALAVFLFGSVMHLPIMHRDYFYIPGYAVGYKISVAYMGFVLLVVLLARQFYESRFYNGLLQRQRVGLAMFFWAYVGLTSLSRAVLGELPQRFPW